MAFVSFRQVPSGVNGPSNFCTKHGAECKLTLKNTKTECLFIAIDSNCLAYYYINI